MNPFEAWIGAKSCFVVWRAWDKSPIDPLHSDPASDYARSNAQDPATWLSWDVASAYAGALGPGYGVGIVLHEGLGLFCVDIDGCVENDELSALASQLVREAFAACPDVYVEVSMSGRGVHIIGPYVGAAPPHSTKNQTLGMELYHDRRYIALTGRRIQI